LSDEELRELFAAYCTVFAMLFLPFPLIWAFNVLFNTSIPYNLETYAAGSLACLALRL
jgi:bacteriorhodopsin